MSNIAKVMQQMRQYCPNEDAEYECMVSGRTLLYWGNIIEEHISVLRDAQDFMENPMTMDAKRARNMRDHITAVVSGTTHKCDRSITQTELALIYSRAVASMQHCRDLLEGMEKWSRDEDGIHPDAYDAYEEAKKFIQSIDEANESYQCDAASLAIHKAIECIRVFTVSQWYVSLDSGIGDTCTFHGVFASRDAANEYVKKFDANTKMGFVVEEFLVNKGMIE